MSEADKLTANAEAWDTGALGREEQYVKRSKTGTEKALSEALGLQMISVRLQQSLIEDLKFIASMHGIGYQPLIRDVLSRFAQTEKKSVMMDLLEKRRLENELNEKNALEAAEKPKQRKAA